MRLSPTLIEIERELSELGIPVARLCHRADLAPTTWFRWKFKNAKPKRETWRRVVAAYETIRQEAA